MYPKKELAQIIVTACSQFKIDTVVISPGSRNAPLTIGFSNHPAIKTMSIVDERCAAFFALGIAQQTQKPVAILCSSGSALLNYYPAIAEAYYSQIPLVVISADRPKHLIDIGDGQTIRQENVFDNHILFSANLIESEKEKEFNMNLVAEALQTATSKKGPVHINVPFDEPLYETVDEMDMLIANKVEQTYTEVVASFDVVKENSELEKLQQIWNTAAKKMIVVGTNYPDEALQAVLNEFEKDPSVIILTETTSNIAAEDTINSIDQLLFPFREEQFKELQPEVLITFGGMVVLKR